jgi:hypothetical protein
MLQIYYLSDSSLSIFHQIKPQYNKQIQIPVKTIGSIDYIMHPEKDKKCICRICSGGYENAFYCT